MSTTRADEVPYLNDIVACVNDTTGGMSITNGSIHVWAFQGSASNTFTPHAQPGFVGEFHMLARDLYPYAFIAPGETVSVAGGAGTVQWAIHPELSAAWTANGFLLAQFKKRGEAALKLAVTGQSASRKAVWTCTKAVYAVGSKAPGMIESPSYDPATQIRTGLGLATSAGECTRSWLAAEREAGNARVAPWVEVVDDANRALKPAAEVFERAATLKKAVQGTLPLICQVFTRC